MLILKILFYLYFLGFFSTIFGLGIKDLMYNGKVGIYNAVLILVLAVFWPYYGYQYMRSI
jgi:hypothetical protein